MSAWNLVSIFLVITTVILITKADDFYENNQGRNGYRNDFDDVNDGRRFNKRLNPGLNGRFGFPTQGFRFPNQGFGFPNQGFGFPNEGFGFPNQGFGFPNRGFGGFPNQGFNPRFGNNHRFYD